MNKEDIIEMHFLHCYSDYTFGEVAAWYVDKEPLSLMLDLNSSLSSISTSSIYPERVT